MDQVPTTDGLTRSSFQPNAAPNVEKHPSMPPEETVREKAVGAFEIKFLVNFEFANKIAEHAKKYLPPDPHAEPEIGDGYRVSSLYFDTPHLDVFRQNGVWKRSKFRLRRYGSSSVIFAERKSKRRGLVTKRRYAIHESEIPLLQSDTCDTTWQGAWYHGRIRSRNLYPTMRICYNRLALTAENEHGPIRFTIDRSLRYLSTDAFDLSPLSQYRTLLDNAAIVEMKFRKSMPIYFKQMLSDYGLTPTAVSKYRLSIADCRLDQQRLVV